MNDTVNAKVLRAAFMAGRADAMSDGEFSQGLEDLEASLEMVLGHGTVLILAPLCKHLWKKYRHLESLVP